MDKETFEAGYCERSQITLDQLRQMGREALPCDCSESECPGWQMGFHSWPEHFPDRHTPACRAAGVCVAHCTDT